MSEPDLLLTKFTIPPLRSAVLPRSQLLSVLDESGSAPLTLLSASAGFGKTTLLSAWAVTISQRRADNRTSVAAIPCGRPGAAWLSLDTQDNDPTRFWTYAIAALRHSGIQVGEAALGMLQSSSPLADTLTSLINELAAQPSEIMLILDDYHLIRERAIHDSLQFLLNHLPSNVHLILASRVEPALPLARLRAKGQVVEIREQDLRLNNDEAAHFLTQVMHIALSEDEVAHLEPRTEGWIAGLQLAALSLRRHTDKAAFIKE